MEQTYKRVESGGISDTSPNEAAQNARVTAKESLHQIDWFEMSQRMIMSQLVLSGKGASNGTNLQED